MSPQSPTKKLELFSQKWHALRGSPEHEASDFIEAVKSKPSLNELVRNPSFLLMALLVHFNARTLPDGRAELYDKISEAYLERIHQFRKLSGTDIPLNHRQKKRLLSIIAYRMMHRRSPIDVRGTDDLSGSDVRVDRKTLTDWINDICPKEGFPISGDEQVANLIKFLSERAGLLLSSGAKHEELFEWPHLSFMEYFASIFLLEEFPGLLQPSQPGDSFEQPSQEHLSCMLQREPWRSP